MKIKEALSKAKNLLIQKSDSPDLDAEILLAHVLKQNREFIFARPNYLLSTKQEKDFGVLLQKRARGWSVAHLLGKKEFFGLEFLVSEKTLIPRPESEILVEKAIPLLQNGGTLVDVGTGTACLSITITKHSQPRKIIAIDIDPDIIKIAKQNAEQHKIKIDFQVNNLLENMPLSKEQKPLILVANLPYVPENEIHPSIKKENSAAIFSGPDGLMHIKEFLQQLIQIDFDTCLLEFHPGQKKELEAIATNLFPQHQINFYKDLANKWRVMEIKKNNI